MSEKTCVYCGKQFNGHGSQRYCSSECARISNLVRMHEKYVTHKSVTKPNPQPKVKMVTVKCTFCGKEFETRETSAAQATKNGGVWCSRECELATYHKTYYALKDAGIIKDKHTIDVRNCRWCGDPFDVDPKRPLQLYCSPRCGQKAQYAKRKAAKA